MGGGSRRVMLGTRRAPGARRARERGPGTAGDARQLVAARAARSPSRYEGEGQERAERGAGEDGAAHEHGALMVLVRQTSSSCAHRRARVGGAGLGQIAQTASPAALAERFSKVSGPPHDSQAAPVGSGSTSVVERTAGELERSAISATESSVSQ
jgi:hypothetical protein